MDGVRREVGVGFRMWGHMYSDVHSVTVPVCCHVRSHSVPDGAPRTETDRTPALGQQGLHTKQGLVF